MDLKITFPGGKKVDADFGAFHVHTDQPVASGGDGSAPAPFDLFLASLGTCAGLYVLGFCRARSIPTEGLELHEVADFDPETHRLVRVGIEIRVPPEFPDKYLGAVRAVAEKCAVKRALFDPPELVVTTA